MNREELEKLLEEAGNNARSRRKGPSRETLRKWLNGIFLVMAVVGLGIYFLLPEGRVTGLAVIGGGMFFKVIEFFIRFMF
ncbi:MAG: hypothetical protein J6B92_10130 [Paraprevotella sp.]|jgi:hypothetical protein|nr:hypothetical protein [Paraprevotella sp.]MBP3471851.1 hypothetical protein [Paraprevotella sp.]